MKICGQLLYYRPCVATHVCLEPWGTEHDHDWPYLRKKRIKL